MPFECIVCGSHDSRIVSELDRRGKPLTTRLCMECGLVCNDPVPDDAELADFYANRYRVEYKGAFHPRGRQIVRNFRRAREHMDMFSDIIRPARAILDVGAGSGEFLFAVAPGADVAIGIEPNKGYADYCRTKLGLDVRTDSLRPDLFEEGRFDYIRLNHVLEHLNDPVRALAMIARFLKPDGVFYVEVPNIETYAVMKSRGNLFHYGHILNFNPWTLRAAAGLAGLEEVAAASDRCAGTTGVFFRKSARILEPLQARNAGNAEHLLALLEDHFKGRTAQSKIARPLLKLRLRAGETLVSFLHRSPAAIGRRVLRQASGAGR